MAGKDSRQAQGNRGHGHQRDDERLIGADQQQEDEQYRSAQYHRHLAPGVQGQTQFAVPQQLVAIQGRGQHRPQGDVVRMQYIAAAQIEAVEIGIHGQNGVHRGRVCEFAADVGDALIVLAQDGAVVVAWFHPGQFGERDPLAGGVVDMDAVEQGRIDRQ